MSRSRVEMLIAPARPVSSRCGDDAAMYQRDVLGHGYRDVARVSGSLGDPQDARDDFEP